jgi:hypothetical protein
MNKEPKNFWKKSWTGPHWFRAWLILVSVLFFIMVTYDGLTANLGGWRDWWLSVPLALLASAVIATIILGLWIFVRWLCCWENFRRFLFGCVCLVTLIALAYAEEDWRGWHAWRQFKHQGEAKGEKFDFKYLAPPPVPDDQNFAMAPIWVESIEAGFGTNVAWQWYGKKLTEPERSRLVDRLDMKLVADESDWPTNGGGNWEKATLTDLQPWQNYYRTLAARTNLFPVAPQPQTPAQDVLLALSKYDSAIEELRQASQRPYARFPLDYQREDVWAVLLPQFRDLKSCAQLLRLRAIAELQNGQTDEALQDIKLLFRLADSIRGEPFLISHLVHIAMLQITLQPIYEGLARRQWSEAQLAELEAELAKLDFLADYQVAMRGERACQISAVEFLRHRNLRHFNEIFNLNGNGGRTQLSVGALLYYLCPSGWLYQNELRVGRFYDRWYLPLVDEKERTVSPAAVRAVDTAITREFRHRTPENFLERWLLPALAPAVKKFAFAQSSTDLARVAIALERCRLAHGDYPESLDALRPQFMEKIPHDVIGGQPLSYRRTGDGQLVLYSVGWNERDDGGVVALYPHNKKMVDISRGDWVWRYPARAE